MNEPIDIPEIRSLIFVYNARSGMGNAVLDSVHKLISPATYECHLCEITFGLIGERKAWKEFRGQSPVPFQFLHKDEFMKAYASKFKPKYTFPIVLAEAGGELEVFISTSDINKMNGTDDLIRAIKSRTGS